MEVLNEPISAPNPEVERIQWRVNAAADAWLREGKNPTVSSVRLKMGGGSPNTVTTALSNWRRTLTQRLFEKDAKAPYPVEVLEAVARIYEVAKQHSSSTDKQTVAMQLRAQLIAMKAELTALRARNVEQTETLSSLQSSLTQSQALAEHQAKNNADLQHLVQLYLRQIGKLKYTVALVRTSAAASRKVSMPMKQRRPKKHSMSRARPNKRRRLTKQRMSPRQAKTRSQTRRMVMRK